MKKLITIVIASLVCLSVFAGDSVRERNGHRETDGWTVSVKDETIGVTPGLITQVANYKQISTPDSIELLSSSASDITQTITIEGINNKNGKRIIEKMSLTGTDVASSDTVFRFIDQVSSDDVALGLITLRVQDDNVFITSIPRGSVEAGMVQHYSGDKNTYITGWKAVKASSNDTLSFDLRFYLDETASSADTLGVATRDSLFIEEEEGSDESYFPQPIKLGTNGWIAVYGQGSTAAMTGTVTLFGYDTNR